MVRTTRLTGSRPMQGSARALWGRRVEVNIKSRDLAVPGDDEIHTGVRRRFAFRPRAPRQASRIVQNLQRAMRRIDIMWMRRSEIAGELVQCVVTDESAGRHVQHTILRIKFLNCAPSASRITFTEYFRKISVEQRLDTPHIYAHRWRDAILAGMLFHRSTPCLWGDDMVAGSTSETAIIESHRFSFFGVWGDGLPRFDGPVLISDMRILGLPITPAPNGRFWRTADTGT